jgi:hypothetical protein
MNALTVVPEKDLELGDDAFSEDGLAVLFVSGGRYGGDWNMAASTGAEEDSRGSFWATRPGGVSPDDPQYPDMAVEAAFGWLAGQARARGWRVLSWENLNSEYGPAERPYFTLARAVLGSERFTPLPGARYADEAGPS